MPEISESFDVDQPVARVWEFFQDVPQVVTCMPGLELTEETTPDVFKGKVKIKLGPVTAAFEGEATIVTRDAEAYRATIEGKGIDKKGGSRASATVIYSLASKGAGTAVTLEADMKLTGTLAQMGRTGIVQDVAHHLTGEFAKALRAKLAESAPAEPEAAPTATPAEPSVTTKDVASAKISGWQVLMAIVRGFFRRLFGGAN